MAEIPPYEIEFYEDDAGNEPALAFMRSLSDVKKRAIGVALNEVLQHLGPNVAEGNFGRNLGGGLYEFRLDQDAEQILRRSGKEPRPEPDKGKILLRVFFHPHGSKLQGRASEQGAPAGADRGSPKAPQALERAHENTRSIRSKRAAQALTLWSLGHTFW